LVELIPYLSRLITGGVVHIDAGIEPLCLLAIRCQLIGASQRKQIFRRRRQRAVLQQSQLLQSGLRIALAKLDVRQQKRDAVEQNAVWMPSSEVIEILLCGYILLLRECSFRAEIIGIIIECLAGTIGLLERRHRLLIFMVVEVRLP